MEGGLSSKTKDGNTSTHDDEIMKSVWLFFFF